MLRLALWLPAWQRWWVRLIRMVDLKSVHLTASRLDREDTGWLHEALEEEQFEPARTDHYCRTGGCPTALRRLHRFDSKHACSLARDAQEPGDFATCLFGMANR